VSQHEWIEVFHPVDIDRYLWVLVVQFGALYHPVGARAFLVDNPPLPFYRPKRFDDKLSILGFNYTPLSSLLILSLVDHPKLAPTTTLICWMVEQEVIVQGTS
jgi:hypothetical protein